MENFDLKKYLNEGKLYEENDSYNKILANKYYNQWLSDYDSSKDFGDSTTFSGAPDDIINGNYETDDSFYPKAEGFEIPEVASIYVTDDKNTAEEIKQISESYKEYINNGKYIIISW